MIKVLANKVFGFSRGERDTKGKLTREKTKIGFCELPDWVASTDLFKLAVKDKSIQPVESTYKSEETVKQNEELEKLRAEVLALKQEKFMAKNPHSTVTEVPKVVKDAKDKVGKKV